MMKGYLYKMLGDEVEELYWSEDPNLYYKIRESRKDYIENSNGGSFEQWYNTNHVSRIVRVFVEDTIFI